MACMYASFRHSNMKTRLSAISSPWSRGISPNSVEVSCEDVGLDDECGHEWKGDRLYASSTQ